MLGSLRLLLQIGFLSVAVIWAINQPGTVHIEWRDHQFDLAFGLCLVGLLLILGISLTFYRIYRGIVDFPKSLKRYFFFQHQQKGISSFGRALSAIAAGDVKSCDKEIRKTADHLGDSNALIDFLHAHQARLHGDDDAAQTYFEALSADSDIGFLGVRGQIQNLLQHQKFQEAYELAEGYYQKHGRKNNWVLQALYQLALRLSRWEAALEWLGKLQKTNILSKEQVQSDQAVLLIAQSDTEKEPVAARRLLEKALKLTPGFAPLILRLSRFYMDQGKRKTAVKIVKKAWAVQPHPDLVFLWDSLQSSTDKTASAARIKWFENLGTQARHHPESRYMMALVYLESGLWGEARKSLTALSPEQRDVRYYDIMAALSRKEKHNEDMAQDYLSEGRTAPDSGHWICQVSNRKYSEWSPVAAPHGSFNSMLWQKSDQVSSTAALLNAGEPMLALSDTALDGL